MLNFLRWERAHLFARSQAKYFRGKYLPAEAPGLRDIWEIAGGKSPDQDHL